MLKKITRYAPDHLIRLLVLGAACAAFLFCGLSSAQTAGTLIQPGASSTSLQEKPPRKAIPASRESMAIGGFKFRIAEVAFDETAMGFVPVGMSAADRLMFVEFELLEGDAASFKSLEISVSCGPRRKTKAVILTSEGIIQMLSTVTPKYTGSSYRPAREHITFIYEVPKAGDQILLHFPTDEILDLAPLIKRLPTY